MRWPILKSESSTDGVQDTEHCPLFCQWEFVLYPQDDGVWFGSSLHEETLIWPDIRLAIHPTFVQFCCQ